MVQARIQGIEDDVGESYAIHDDITGAWTVVMEEAFPQPDVIRFGSSDDDTATLTLGFEDVMPRRTLMNYIVSFPAASSMLVGLVDSNALLRTAQVLQSFAGEAWNERTLRTIKISTTEGLAVPPRTLTQETLGLAMLPAGWDGYHAARIQPATVSSALAVLNHLYRRAGRDAITIPDPIVGPTPDGSIQFEWEHPDLFLSIRVGEDDTLSIYLERTDGQRELDAASEDDVWDAVQSAFKA